MNLRFEYVSHYRHIVVVQDGSGFELRVSYKGMAAECRPWARRYGMLADAIAWAKAASANKDIVIGILTMKDFNGNQII